MTTTKNIRNQPMTSYLCNRSADWLLTVTGRGWFQWDRTQTHAHRTTRIRSHAGTSHRHSEIAAHPSNTPSTAPPLPLRGLAVYRLSATEGTFMTCHQSLSCTEAFRNILNFILPLSIRLSASFSSKQLCLANILQRLTNLLCQLNMFDVSTFNKLSCRILYIYLYITSINLRKPF